MKKELEYFAIEGAFGGNQDWFSNVVMNMGGSLRQRRATAVSILQNIWECVHCIPTISTI